MTSPSTPPPTRVVIDAVRPRVDGGDVPIKRVVGDTITFEAHLLVDGHEHLAGALLIRRAGEPSWTEVPLVPVGKSALMPSQPANDEWRAEFTVDAVGRWEYTVTAWIDAWGSWAWGLRRKVEAGQDVAVELQVGAALVDAAAGRAPGASAGLRSLAVALRGDADPAARAARALSPEAMALMGAHPDRRLAVVHAPSLALVVDPRRAGFSSWYEMFPRSCGPAGQHGTFKDAEKRLPYVADMGFDVLYLPPIHPIGRTFRKGPDNSLQAGPQDPGSPWAIGGAEGGHKDIHPQLGTLEDFRHFVEAARQQGMEVAMDIAFQTSPDHPYVKEHPEWFIHRPDGTIQYAENPPKKYQDIYPFDFAGAGAATLWPELRGIFSYWIAQGVKVFRVDNPHTKPIPFWSWCIDSLKAEHPDVIFLAEAFTRPKLTHALAKAGFSQSYTYFTWRTTKAELTAYLSSIVSGDVKEYFRPNFWPNTPDILPEQLQFGTRGTFLARAVLAATLSPNWGIYGPAYELQERVARAGAEEYAQNEKYQLRTWDLDRPDSLRPLLRRLNAIRRDNPALQRLTGTVFHHTDNESLICYSRSTDDHRNTLLVVVNLDPHHRHSGFIDLDLKALMLTPNQTFQAHDLIGDARYLWRGGRAFVTLDPQVMPAHVFSIRRRVHTEQTFEYYL